MNYGAMIQCFSQAGASRMENLNTLLSNELHVETTQYAVVRY